MAKGNRTNSGVGGGIGSRSMAKTTVYNVGKPSQRVNPGATD